MNSAQKIKISNLPDFDVVDYLKTEADITGYLTAVLEDGDPALFVAAIGDIARAKGMSDIAKKSGVTRESLYRALKIEAHPRFETVVKVIHALGMKLSVEVESKKKGLQKQPL
jgi:probable addiction module antidote protein